MKEKKISASLTIRDIKELNETKKTGKLVPGNSLLTEKAYFYQDIAITETKNQLELYCQRGSSISLPFFMHFLLKQQQKVLVHSAGVSIGGQGIILSAFGGIGKTAFTASILKEKNVKILGDDLVVLNKNGNLSAYQRPLGLYCYHKNLFPEYFKSDTRFFLPNSKFSNKYKLLKRIFNKSLKILNLDELFITESILISPENLFGLEKIESDEVPLKDAYIINRYNNLSKLECIHINDHQKIARFSKSVMAHEWVECCYRFLINKLAIKFDSGLHFPFGNIP